MNSISQILLVYDGTPEADSALLRCAALARALSASVHVVAVTDFNQANEFAYGLFGWFSAQAAAQLEEHTRTLLKEAIMSLTMLGIVARGYHAFGEVTDAISRSAALLESDVVVIGHRSRTWLARWFGDRPVHQDLAERLKGMTLITVTTF